MESHTMANCILFRINRLLLTDLKPFRMEQLRDHFKTLYKAGAGAGNKIIIKFKQLSLFYG